MSARCGIEAERAQDASDGVRGEADSAPSSVDSSASRRAVSPRNAFATISSICASRRAACPRDAFVTISSTCASVTARGAPTRGPSTAPSSRSRRPRSSPCGPWISREARCRFAPRVRAWLRVAWRPRHRTSHVTSRATIIGSPETAARASYAGTKTCVADRRAVAVRHLLRGAFGFGSLAGLSRPNRRGRRALLFIGTDPRRARRHKTRSARSRRGLGARGAMGVPGGEAVRPSRRRRSWRRPRGRRSRGR
jgi:hypothetical protein